MTGAQLRARAKDCSAQARTAGGERAQQLRECARSFMALALKADLFSYGQVVGGRKNVTAKGFQEYLRNERTLAK